MKDKDLKESKELVLFENSRIRRQMYNDEWYYSIVDIIAILTESAQPSRYWNEFKKQLGEEEAAEKVAQKNSELESIFSNLLFFIIKYKKL